MCFNIYGMDYYFSPFINYGIIMNYYTLLILVQLPLAWFCRHKRDKLKGSGKINPIGKWHVRMILFYFMIPLLIIMFVLSSCSPKTRPFKYSGDAEERNNKR